MENMLGSTMTLEHLFFKKENVCRVLRSIFIQHKNSSISISAGDREVVKKKSLHIFMGLKRTE